MMPVSVLDIATTLPSHVCSREQSLHVAQKVFANDPQALEFLTRLMLGSGIEKRHTVIADYAQSAHARNFFSQADDFRPEPSTQKRNKLFVQEADALSFAACQKLGNGDWASKVTHLITASCTGFSAPGFDISLVRRLGLSPRVQRTHVGFMGCYAGFTTLRLARAICTAQPQALVLIVHVELCSLHVHFRSEPDTLVANSLFADGVAAALIGGPTHESHGNLAPLRLHGEGSFLLPGGEDDMTWNIGDQGFDMTLSPRVPFMLNKHLPAAFRTLLQEHELTPSQIAHWAIHPGGPAILEKTCKALEISDDAVDVSRTVLREHGNMSSSTIWFVLDQLRQLPQAGYVYACGFGPGLTLESALLHHPGANP